MEKRAIYLLKGFKLHPWEKQAFDFCIICPDKQKYDDMLHRAYDDKVKSFEEMPPDYEIPEGMTTIVAGQYNY